MKQITIALAILFITFSQNVLAQTQKKQDTPECQTLMNKCRESWNNAKKLNDENAHTTCITTCTSKQNKCLENTLTAISDYKSSCSKNLKSMQQKS